MLLCVRYASLVLTVSVVLTVFLTGIAVNRVKPNFSGRESGIKSVVAYSLRKRIELEGREIPCGGYYRERGESITSGISNSITNSTDTEGKIRGVEGDSWVEIPGTKLHVYGVYLDRRLEPYGYLRIIGMVQGAWEEDVYCQTFTATGDYHVAKASRADIWASKWHPGKDGFNNPVLLSCQIPGDLTPTKVSLNTEACRPSTKTLPVSPSPLRTDKKLMAVCVKPLNFRHDISEHLVQWIEIVRLLGASSVDIYVGKVHGNVERLLKWYATRESRGVRVTFHGDLPVGSEGADAKSPTAGGSRKGDVSSVWQKRKNELIAYNDCFYRNVHSAHFVVPLDVDEVLVPVKDQNFQEYFKRKNATTPDLFADYASLSARNAYFFREEQTGRSPGTNKKHSDTPFSKTTDNGVTIHNGKTIKPSVKNIARTPFGNNSKTPQKRSEETLGKMMKTKVKEKPPREFFFRNILRAPLSPELESGKSFILTANTLTVFNHYSLEVLRPGTKRTHFLPEEEVRMNHYRQGCSMDLLPECGRYFFGSRILDDVILKYVSQFDRVYRATVDQLRKSNFTFI